MRNTTRFPWNRIRTSVNIMHLEMKTISGTCKKVSVCIWKQPWFELESVTYYYINVLLQIKITSILIFILGSEGSNV